MDGYSVVFGWVLAEQIGRQIARTVTIHIRVDTKVIRAETGHQMEESRVPGVVANGVIAVRSVRDYIGKD